MSAELQQKMNSFTCRNCNAPAVSRICPFCGSDTGLDHSLAIEQLEYPVLEAKDASFNIKLFGIFSFIIIFLATVIIFLLLIKIQFAVILFVLFLLFYEVYAIYILIKSVIDFLMVKKKGKEYNCLAFGYFDSTKWTTQEEKYRNKQTLKMLINYEGQNRFILCETDMIYKKYHENTHLKVKLYKKKYIVYGEVEEVIPL